VRRQASSRDWHAYTVFGLRVAASGVLPGLRAGSTVADPDLVVELQAAAPLPRGEGLEREPIYRSPDVDDAGRPMAVVERLDAGRLFRFRYADGIEFVVDGGGRHIWAAWPEPWTVDDVATYLLGSVMAFALRRRGITCLHASAVAIDERAVAFIGPAGAGKSTLAATLATRGYAVVSDDVVALGGAHGEPVAQPGPSRIRLWPESVQALYGSPDALPRLTPTWDKRFLDATQDGCRFQERPLPLAAVYVLDERRAHPALPRLELLSAAAGLMALVANTQASHLLDARTRAQEFHCLGRIAASLRVCRVTPSEPIAGLSALCDVVIEDVLESAAHV
jgi:hypothetical protein